MRDPLANLNFLEADYTWVTQKLMEVADRHANGRVVSLLEGGYDLEGLREVGRRACHRADAGVTVCAGGPRETIATRLHEKQPMADNTRTPTSQS